MVCLACLISSPSLPHPSEQRLRCIDAVRRLGELSITDFQLVKTLGRGHNGTVYLGEMKCGVAVVGGVEGCVVAVKVMKKEREERAKNERAILEVLDHPFLPRLFGTFQDEKGRTYLLTEYCNGGDLHRLALRQPRKRFNEAAVRFYAAEVVAALEYMHMMGIIHRDLKPENVLIRSDGHIMITDFDLSLLSDSATTTPPQLVSRLPKRTVPSASCLKKHGCRNRDLQFVAEPVDLRSNQYVGTLDYLAAEIVRGEEHGSSVDWWTLGIFMYELLYGFTPFHKDDTDMTIDEIEVGQLTFPKQSRVSAAAEDLIAGLLLKDPAKRLGSQMGATEIKQHRFFAGVNWALLRCARPPYVPPPYCSCRNRTKL